tara:strand:+ start:143 stop:643 length:501 start_codon:yes stop_codon:yes gene_type:complete
MERFLKFFCRLIACLLICCCFFINSKNTSAYSQKTFNYQGNEIQRSLESLRDLDYQTWQIIVYPSSKASKNLNLRIVGYPGSLRIDHPTNLIVNSGRKNWDLKDITKVSQAKLETLNDSAAEFDLSPLMAELEKNRPLRLTLPGSINDLPIPPYLVGEWRTLGKEQ